MIDKRELMEKARKWNLSLGAVEKDYVQGWLLFGISRYLPDLIFKGGTALSKIYFPLSRLSEDLDFNLLNGFEAEKIITGFSNIFDLIYKKAGIKLSLKSKHSNPDYLQFKIQYEAVLKFKNFIKIDINKGGLIEKPSNKELQRVYSDYPSFSIKVKTLDEIFAAKIRTTITRVRCRDYYDIYKLLESHRIDIIKIKKLVLRKCNIQKFKLSMLKIGGLNDYWNKELGRLVYPIPKLNVVLDKIKEGLKELE